MDPGIDTSEPSLETRQIRRTVLAQANDLRPDRAGLESSDADMSTMMIRQAPLAGRPTPPGVPVINLLVDEQELGMTRGLTMPAAPDDEGVVESINAAWGTALTVEGRAEKGTLGGAILVTLLGDRPGVVTRFLGPISEAQRTAQILSEARRRGLPVAEQHLVAPVGEDVFMVQERLPGRPPGLVTPAVITGIILLNERFAHALRFWPEVPGVVLCLSASGDPYPRHEVLAEHSDRSRAILRRIRSIGQGVPEVAAGDDLVHVDLTPDNVLFDDDGGVTGVVDWNLGVYRGDRHLALVKTRFDLRVVPAGGSTQRRIRCCRTTARYLP